MIKLRISSKSGVNDFQLKDKRITLGRSDDCTVKIDDKNISRHHTAIEAAGDEYRVVDLESRNGTYLNESRIQTAALSKDDVIRIGDVRIYILEVPECRETSEVHLKPVPVREKEQVRNKIDDLKRMQAQEVRSGGISRSLSSLFTAAAALILVGGVAFGVVLVLRMQADREGAPKKATVQKQQKEDGLDHYREEALAELENIERQVKPDEVPPSGLLSRLSALQKKYAEYFEQGGDTVHDPFQRLINEWSIRRAIYLEEEFETVNAEVEKALVHKEFARATGALQRFHQKGGGGYSEAAELMERISVLARSDYEQLMQQVELLKKYKRYRDIASLCQSSLDRFKGTQFRGNIALQLDIAEKRSNEELQLARRKRYKGAAVPAPTRDVGTPAPATPAPEAGKPAAKPRVKVDALTAKFIDAVKKRKITSVQKDGSKLPLSHADVNGVKSGGKTLSWEELGFAPKAAALVKVLYGDSLLQLAHLAQTQGEPEIANLALYSYLKADKNRKEEVDEIVSAWRGLGSPPEGGYSWNKKRKLWEDAFEKTSSAAVAKAEGMIRSLSRVASPQALKGQWARVERIIKRNDITTAARNEIRKMVVDALKEAKVKKLEEIKRRSAKPAGDISSAARRLADARKECLRVMYDPKIYFHEGDPNYAKGLRDYLDSCKPLHNVWNGNWRASIDGSLRAAVETVEKINEVLSKKLGSPAGNDLSGPELEEFIANQSAKGNSLTIQKYALTRAQRETYNYNDRVDKYNNGTYQNSLLSSTGAPGDTIAHLNILNAWREEIGRKKLFMDPRLQKAAQKHASDQAAAGKIWHVGSNGSPSSRCKAEGFNGPVGENCCRGFGSPAAAFRAWDQASDHCRNQCSDNWNCVGVGHVGSTWVQDFGRTKPPPEIGG